MARATAYDEHPEHKVEIDAEPTSVRVVWNGHVLADSPRARILREGRYPAVAYVPREDVDMSKLERSEHTTYCPFKGTASYYSLVHDAERSENTVWTYEDPYDQVEGISGHLAFYADRVEIEGVS
ncbi:MAG: DUF427 domain-containing protein [Myxococcota bacterium]|nr:DUF427 domain-containing protein [Myxococcota bacterium]